MPETGVVLDVQLREPQAALLHQLRKGLQAITTVVQQDNINKHDAYIRTYVRTYSRTNTQPHTSKFLNIKRLSELVRFCLLASPYSYSTLSLLPV